MNTNKGQQLDDDTTTMILIGLLFGPALLAAGIGVVAAQVPEVASWLTQRNVLVAPADNPLLVIPGTAGAGLDLMRIIPIASAILLALIWAVWLSKSKMNSEEGTRNK